MCRETSSERVFVTVLVVVTLRPTTRQQSECVRKGGRKRVDRRSGAAVLLVLPLVATDHGNVCDRNAGFVFLFRFRDIVAFNKRNNTLLCVVACRVADQRSLHART